MSHVPGTTAVPDGLWAPFVARIRVPILLLLGAVAYGTVGYVVILGWPLLDALYMTVTTLTTVGFGEVRPMDTDGRIFTITLIVFGVIIVFAIIGAATQIITSGEFGEPLRRRKMRRRIEELVDHYIVCAYGRVGRAAVEELTQQGVDFCVVEVLPELSLALDKAGIPYIVGDPSDESVLKSAGVERARGLVCAVDSDAVNVYITLTARALNPSLSIVSRAANPGSVDKLLRAGADRVVSPYVLSGKRMASLAIQPSVVEFFDMVTVAPDLRLEEIVIRPSSLLDGRTVGDAMLTYQGITVLAVKKRGGGLTASPDPDTPLAAGDLVVTLGPVKRLAELAR